MLSIDAFNIFRDINSKLSEEDIKMMNPLSLAYIGDAVFEMLIRTEILTAHKNARKLHIESSKKVNAKAQADFYERIKESLDDRELGVFNRAKNSKLNTVPKNADVHDYKKSTGLEAIFGYLYLMKKDERILELYRLGEVE